MTTSAPENFSRPTSEAKTLWPMALGVVLLVAAVLWAWVEPRPGQFESRPRLTSPQWWWTPIENNASKRPPSIASRKLTSIAVIPGSNGRAVVAVGSDDIVWSTDGGIRWHSAPDLTPGFFPNWGGVAFVAPDAGWAVGQFSKIFRTSDGGRNWKEQMDKYGSDFFGVSFWTVESGCVVGDLINGGGFLSCTSNGGMNWRTVNLPQIQRPNGLATYMYSTQFLDDNFGWVVGQQTIIHTTDGGAHWKSEFTDPHQTFWAVTMMDRRTGWAVGQHDDGSATILRYTGDAWIPTKLNDTSPSLTKTLRGVAFADRQSGWAVGDHGTIFHTSDGGENWNQQQNGADADLFSVAFVDTVSGWTSGTDGTILHTTDGGANWTMQASGAHWDDKVLNYHRWPSPLFWVLIASALLILVRSVAVERGSPRTKIEELISADSPVIDVKDDKLGHRILVERLTSFISNSNTTPPLVISLQARWGMGKSSVMRMMESNLKENRAAVTVWFNAWHHQREDQILAYLLETIQKEAIPSWFTPLGLRFRINLLVRRIFGRTDRLVLVLVATVFLILCLVGAIPSGNAVQKWLSRGSAALLGLVVVRSMVAFKSNPEVLVEHAGGFLAQTVKELLTLPSLVGKTDVRQMFAENLKDVVEALKPQRLVIFLDDLDRCRPEQVVPLLEAVNFLSSAAACFVVLGADYEKVEALAALQFEAIAMREEENRGAQDVAGRAVAVSVSYARKYLRKIINLRLNLRLPVPLDFRQMLREPPPTMVSRERFVPRAAVAAILLTTILGVTWIADFVKSSSQRHVIQTAVANSKMVEPGRLESVPSTDRGGKSPRPENRIDPRARTMTNAQMIAAGDNRWLWVLGPPAFVILIVFVYWRSRPRHLGQAHDTQSFGDALEQRVEEVCSKCDSPREVRRFLNYLRLIATGSDAERVGDIGALRKKYGGRVDQYLVELATMGSATASGPEAAAVEEYYSRQCDLFGLDPRTFAPREISPEGRSTP